MAQADELARLRDEVRGSAEREAMEIVTAARRDIRQIVMEARRELFVLSAQVQAALGEGVPGAPQLGPPAVAHDEDRGTAEDDLSAFSQEEWGFAPRSTVVAVLDEARADMAVLDRDARAVPSRAPAGDRPAVSLDSLDEPPATSAGPLLTAVAAGPLLRPTTSGRDSAEVHGTSGRLFVAVSALAALAVVLGTLWMLRGPAAGAADAPPATRAAVTPPPAPAVESGAAAAGVEARPTSVTLSIEAVRPAWVRAIVDGRPDAGQMLRAGETYEFNGRSIALRVGDAGAVLVSVNGGEAARLGRDGQVVDREFTLNPPVPDPGQPPAVDSAPAQETPQATSGAADTAPFDVPPLPAAAAPVLSPEIGPSSVAATSGFSVASTPPRTIEHTGAPASTSESVLVAAAQRWLDAYHRQDRPMLTALSTPTLAVIDERPTGERMPLAAGAIARTLDRVSIRVAADTAVLTAVMVERAVDGGLEHSSPISLLWVSSAGAWRLSQARLVSQSTLGQIFR